MQFSGDTALAAAIDANDRILVHKVEFDWNQNGLYDHYLADLSMLVEDIRIESALSGTLPEECTLTEGFQSSKMTLTLSGIRPDDIGDIAQLLSPYQTLSYLYGSEFVGIAVRCYLTVRKADGTDTLVPQFVGRVVEINVKGATRQVMVTALDNAERCHNEITLPIMAMSTWFDQNPIADGSMYWRQNTQWVIDFALRKCGFYQSPSAPPTVMYSATCHGSATPEVGYGFQPWIIRGASPSPGEWYVPGVYGLAMNGSSKFESYWVGTATALFEPKSGDSTNEWSIQFLAKFGAGTAKHVLSQGYVVVMSSGGAPWTGTSMAVRVDTNTGATSVEFWDGGVFKHTVAGPTFAADGWHHLAVKVKFNNLTNATITWKGQSPTTNDISGIPASPSIGLAIIQTIFPFPVQCLQIEKAASATWYDTGTFVPTANLDAGLNHFISMPEVVKEEAWSVIQTAAESEFGTVGFDESGKAYFRNRNTLRSGNLVVEKTVTADSTLLDYSVAQKIESVRNVVTTSATPRWETSAKTIWEITELDYRPFITSGYHPIQATLKAPYRFLASHTLTGYSSADWENLNPEEGFVAYDPYTATEVSASTYVAVSLNSDGWSFRIDVVNQVINPIAFQTADGAPALRVLGFPIENLNAIGTTYRRQSSIDRYGERPLVLPTNPYVQDPTSYEPIVLSLLKDLKAPVPVMDRIPVVGDPRLQLGDTVDIADPGGIGSTVTASVIGITRTLAGGKLTDEITPRPVGAPGSWILGHATRSILASTTILG